MSTFFISEASNGWKATSAKTLAGAKRAASANQMFQGTDIFVGVKSGDEIHAVCKKLHPDALNMASKGRWEGMGAHDLELIETIVKRA